MVPFATIRIQSSLLYLLSGSVGIQSTGILFRGTPGKESPSLLIVDYFSIRNWKLFMICAHQLSEREYILRPNKYLTTLIFFSKACCIVHWITLSLHSETHPGWNMPTIETKRSIRYLRQRRSPLWRKSRELLCGLYPTAIAYSSSHSSWQGSWIYFLETPRLLLNQTEEQNTLFYGDLAYRGS